MKIEDAALEEPKCVAECSPVTPEPKGFIPSIDTYGELCLSPSQVGRQARPGQMGCVGQATQVQ